MPKTINSSYEDLVKKAQHYFWINGYKAATPKELAEHLEVSTSTIYNKFTKDMLFISALEDYVNTCSDPVLKMIRDSDQGMESFRDFFYKLIDALLDRSFPRSCIMVTTVVEIRNEQPKVTSLYERYFGNMIDSYKTVLNRAVTLGEIKHPERVDQYAEFLQGVIFMMGILYKIKSKEVLRLYVDEQLSLIK